MKIVGIIPARYASERFPGKPLADLVGKPMIQHVYERTRWANVLDRLLVATDDRRIYRAVEDFGGEAVMTSPDHPTGTDRLAEVAGDLPGAELIINIQGDEPLIHPEMVDAVVLPLRRDPQLMMGTLKKRIDEQRELEDPNVVKVVCDQDGYALYFSRSCIPHPNSDQSATIYKHIGLYVYRREFLLDYVRMEPTPLEMAESLEQLRVLENGYRIRVVETTYNTIGVDTPQDLEMVTRILQEDEDDG